MAKGEGRRIELLNSAAYVFLEHGYEATSMNVIAERANVTKPGLYYHFRSKQELLFSIMSYALDFLEQTTHEVTLEIENPEQRLRNLLASHARMITEEREGAFTLLVIDLAHVLPAEERRAIERRKRSYFELVRSTLEQLERDDRLRPGVDITVATFSVLGMVMWISKWFRPQGALSHEQVAEQVTELAMCSLLPDDRRLQGDLGSTR